MSSGRRRSRTIMSGVLVAAAAVGAGLPAPSPAQVPPLGPEVAFVDGFGPSTFGYLDCDGELFTEVQNFGVFFIELDDEVLVDTELVLTYAGTLADDIVDRQDTVTVPAGESFVDLEFELDEYEAGDLTLTVEPGVGYEVDPDDTVTLEVTDEAEIAFDCNDDLGNPPDDTDRQTIRVGQRPEPIGFYGDGDIDEEDFPFGLFDAEFASTPLGDGSIPPGLTYADDEWDGAATTVGTYTFDIRLCLEDFFGEETTQSASGAARARALQRVRAFPSVVCIGTVDVEVVVEAAAASNPPGAAPPATPVAGQARFTG